MVYSARLFDKRFLINMLKSPEVTTTIYIFDRLSDLLQVILIVSTWALCSPGPYMKKKRMMLSIVYMKMLLHPYSKDDHSNL